MKKGAIVFNISQKDNPIFISQINAFLHAFNTLAMAVEVYSNAEIFELLQYKYDFVLFWDKDLFAAELLESHGYRLFNKQETIRLCDDKGLTYLSLQKAKIRTPLTYVLPLTFKESFPHYQKELLDNIAGISYPVVVKERKGSFGEQVYLAKNQKELFEIIQSKESKGLLIQQFIKSQNLGEDYRINIVNNQVITAVKRTNAKDFRSNVNQGGKMVQCIISEEMEKLALVSAKAVGADFCGVDIICDENGVPFVLEINSNARTLGVHQTTGVDLTMYIGQFIKKEIGD